MKKTYEEGIRDGRSEGYDEGYDNGKTSGIFWGGLATVVAILITVLMVETNSVMDSYECVTIDSKIISIDYETDESFYTVHFKDGSIYNINKDTSSDQSEVIDFDDSENVIVELSYRSGLFFKNTDDVWDIVKLIKY